MSVVVVVSDGKQCWMAADSQATQGASQAPLATPKIVREFGMLFSVPSILVGNILRQELPMSPPQSQLKAFGLLEWAGSCFQPWLRRKLESWGQLEKLSDGRSEMPGTMLIARGGDFVVCDVSGGVFRVARSWHAVGSGGAEATGALWALETRGCLPPEQMAMLAVGAACALDVNCSGALTVECTAPEERPETGREE